MLAPVDEDLPELDIPDILQALLATDDPSALFQTGVPAHQPMTMFSTPFCPASLPVGVDTNIRVGTVLVGQQSEPAVQAQTDAQKPSQKQKKGAAPPSGVRCATAALHCKTKIRVELARIEVGDVHIGGRG